LLLHLLSEGVLEGEVVPAIDEQLVLEVLRRVEVLAGRLLPVTPALNTVIAGGHPAVLHLHVGRRVGELALAVRAGALLPLELPAHLQLEPPGVLLVEQRGDVEHGEDLGVDVGGVGHGGVGGHWATSGAGARAGARRRLATGRATITKSFLRPSKHLLSLGWHCLPLDIKL